MNRTRWMLRATLRRPSRDRPRPPGPPGRLLLGNVHLLREDPLGALLELRRRYGDVVRLRFGPMQVVLLAAPRDVQTVLLDRWKDFSKDTRGWEKLRPVLGDGLLTSDGPLWLRQRRLIQPGFDRRALPDFAPAMVAAARGVAERWETAADRGEVVDVVSDMMDLALRVVCDTLLGAEAPAEAQAVGRAMETLQGEINHRMFSLLDVVERLPLPRNRRFAAELQRLRGMVETMVESRRRQRGRTEEDLMGRLLAATDEESGEGMSDVQLRDEIMTLFLAGHETTANGLAWTFYEWMLHPEAADHAAEEAAAVLGGRDPEVADLERLGAVLRSFQEGLRLHPPAWISERMAEVDAEFGGYDVPAGTMILLSPWVTHRHPEHWEEPERFDPERFLPERSGRRHRYAWFPFGGGPHVCVGRDFALLEAHLALSVLAPRFRLEPAWEGEVEADAFVTLRPRGGLPARVHRR